MEAFPFNISSGNENIREILGFFHHQISQQAKDIALLNRRLAELSNAKSEAEEGPSLNVFMQASTKQLDGFAASIRAVTDQLLQHENLVKKRINTISNNLRSEFTEKLDRLNNRIDEVQHMADNSKCNEDMLELKLSEISAKQEEREIKFEREILSLRDGQIVPPEVTTKPRAQSRMSVKRGLVSRPATTTSSRRKRTILPKETTMNVQHMKIFDVRPTKLDINQELKEAKNAINEIKNAENSMREIREMLQITNAKNEKEFALIYEKLDDCALKTDLYNIVQGFIASGADGVADAAARSRVHQGSLSLVCEQTKHVTSQNRCAHVKLITGECLKRPVTTPGRTRLRSYCE